MAGRKSTGPLPIHAKPPAAKSGKRKKERSLNALAIAEKSNPDRPKIRKHRLGQDELEENTKRKREIVQQDGSDDDDNGYGRETSLASKRRKTTSSGNRNQELDYGSDSEGNEWVTGGVGSEDDSSLNSDEAFGESDEERFEGFNFGGSSPIGAKGENRRNSNAQQASTEVDLDEGEENGSIDDDLGDEGVDMAAVLDAGSDSDDGNDGQGGRRSLDSEGEVHDKLQKNDDSALSVTDEEEDYRDSAKIESVRSLVNTLSKQDEAQAPKPRMSNNNQSNNASESGTTFKQKATITDILSSITNPELKKFLRVLADSNTKPSSKRSGTVGKLDVPLVKRQRDRLDRAAAYEKSKETIDRWTDTVKYNRRAEHLSFPLQNPGAMNARGGDKLDRQTKPLTDLEMTIQSILYDSGLAPTNEISEEGQIQAFEQLQANKMPLEEVQARRAELRKARDLLFREEIRARRIKKIKSKSYRRVHRKERERLVQKDKEALAMAGVEDSESEKERRDRRRAEERMGAKYRESRWAKGVKESGRMAWDEDARSGVEEMAKREEDLKRRILGKDPGSSDEEESSDATEEDEDGSNSGKASSMLLNRLRRLDEGTDGMKKGVRNSTSALSSMKFMQNAEAAQKLSNEEAIKQVQRELAGEETPSEEEPESTLGRRLYGPSNNARQPTTKAEALDSRSEFEERQLSNDEAEENSQIKDDDLQIIVDSNDTVKPASVQYPSNERKAKWPVKKASSQASGFVEENPWLSGGKTKSSARDRRQQDSRATAIITNGIPNDLNDVGHGPNAAALPKEAISVTEEVRNAPTSPPIDSNSEVEDSDDASNVEDGEAAEKGKGPLVFRNQDLVRKAFAGDDVVASFEKEKEETMQSEDEKVIDDTLAGWGHWTGAGISKKAQRRNKNRVTRKQEGIPRAKRQDAKLKKVVINEKRVKKNVKYLASQLPHPFETKQQYERSLRLPVGPEWTTKETFQAATKPRVLMKQGIITPMARPMV
ncbi:MAG: hypothetical protein Q9220_004993 [cf. Caloplaca sp. 1 TL-2023]